MNFTQVKKTGGWKGYEKIINSFICRLFNANVHDRKCICRRIRTGLQRGNQNVSGFL